MSTDLLQSTLALDRAGAQFAADTVSRDPDLLAHNTEPWPPRTAQSDSDCGIARLPVSGAIFLILEMNNPLEGMIKVSAPHRRYEAGNSHS